MDDLELMDLQFTGLEQMLKTARGQWEAVKASLLKGSRIHRIDVPWVGQNTAATTDDWSNSDCGPACNAMLLRWLKKDVTVDECSKAAGLPQNYKGTAYWDLTKIMRVLGNTLMGRRAGLTLADLRATIDAMQPAIILVHYGSLPKRSDQTFVGGHWVLLVGYNSDADTLIYHDPYWKDSAGAFIECPSAVFLKAMADCSLDRNTPNQGVFFTSKG